MVAMASGDLEKAKVSELKKVASTLDKSALVIKVIKVVEVSD